MNANRKKPKIILWDIETLPDMKEVMKVFPSLSNYPGLTLKATINSIICVGWKEFGKGKVNCINAWDFKKRWKRSTNDDYEVVKAAYEVLKDADVVVTHNGKRFDWKFLQTRILYHGMYPLPRILHIDTCLESRRHLLAFNNKLDTIGKLAHTQKMDNGGWPLWVEVSLRKPNALKKMTAYCKQDVVALEKVFKTLRPLLTSLPNHNLYSKSQGCPSCGSTRLQKRGERVTKENRVQRYQCLDCGSWSSAAKKYPKV
jgi:hypothetical protein